MHDHFQFPCYLGSHIPPLRADLMYQHFHGSKQWYDWQCLALLTCTQMLMHATAYWDFTSTMKEYALKPDTGRRNPCCIVDFTAAYLHSKLCAFSINSKLILQTHLKQKQLCTLKFHKSHYEQTSVLIGWSCHLTFYAYEWRVFKGSLCQGIKTDQCQLRTGCFLWILSTEMIQVNCTHTAYNM